MSYKGGLSAYTYNNNSNTEGVEPLMNSLIELVKAQQEILELLKKKV